MTGSEDLFDLVAGVEEAPVATETLNNQMAVENTPEPVEAVQEPIEPTDAVEPMSFGEAFDYSYEYETLTGYGYRALSSKEFEPDPTFSYNFGDLEEQYPDLPREMYEELLDTESQAELDYKAGSLIERLDKQASFEAMHPAKQVGTLLSSTVLDAPALGLAVLTGAGTSAVLGRLGLTTSRVGKILAGGAAGLTEATAIESILATKDPLKDQRTVALAAVMGFGFGAIGGEVSNRITKSRLQKAAEKDADNLRKQIVERAVESQSTGKTPAIEDTVSSTAGENLESLYQNVPKVEDEGIRNLAVDMTSQLKRSKDEGFKELGNILGEDPVYGGGATIALDLDVTARPLLADFQVGVNDGYTQWAKENGINMFGRIGHKSREDFNALISNHVRGTQPSQDPGVIKAAKTTQDFMRKMLDNAKSAGLEGVQNTDADLKYLTRIYSEKSFKDISEKLGADSKDIIIRTLAGAIKNGGNDFDDALASKIAKGIYRRTLSTQPADSSQFTTVLTNDFKNELQGHLTDAGIDTEEIEGILRQLTKKSGGAVSQTKPRIDMDEGFVDPESGLRFTDLLENNTEAIVSRYSRGVGGATSAAKFGYKTPEQLYNKIEKTRINAIESGSLSRSKADSLARKSTNLANQLFGKPNEAQRGVYKFLQGAMDYEYVRTSGGFALASIPEMMISTAENGLRATLRHVPMANKFVRDISKGSKPDDQLLNLIESWGVGRDIDLINSFVRHAEDDTLDGTFNTITKGLNVGKRAASMASGLPQLTRFSQVLAAKSSIQRFTDLAVANKPVKMKQWLKQLGFAEEQDLQDVFTGLRKYTKTAQGFTKSRKVTELDWDSWLREDPIAATRFQYAIARRTNHQIQRNLQGELPEFMSKTIGKLIMQFRTFGVAAHGKKTLNALARRDVETAVAIALTSAMATLVHAGRMYVMAPTRDDPEGFLKERLDPTELAKVSLQRSGFAAMLPTMVDTAFSWSNQDKIFNSFSRTSGLDVGGVDSVPSFSTAINAGKTLGVGIDAAVDGDRLEEKDVRAMTDLLPFRRLPGVNFTFEKLINEMPQKGREE